VAVSIGVCGLLVFVGGVRMLSYSLGPAGDIVRHSVFGFLCYDPDSAASVRFFKVLATPSVVALFYFLFRWRNAGAPRRPGASGALAGPALDFTSPVLRAILTSVITLHWLGMEWWKFHVDGFYPWSPLESRWLNVVVLLVGQAFAFQTMKYLSFEPNRRQSGAGRDASGRMREDRRSQGD
jgi:hypothetical protein